MTDLNALVIFAKVVDEANFTRAAKRLGIPISTVSRKISELEDQLGVRLLERSTRQLRLTNTGVEILEHAQRIVEVSETIENVVSNQQAEVKGTLRLSAPPSISDSVLSPLISAFQASYPQVHVRILVTEQSVDHITEGIDLEFCVGPLSDSNLVIRRILRYRHLLVASPQYMATIKPPEKPQDLLEHPLLAFSHWTPQSTWNFAKGQRKETITFYPHLTMNDYVGLAKALESGAGIGDLPPIVCPELIKEGRLVEVMPNWHFPVVDLSILYLSNRHMPRAVRLFKDFSTEFVPQLFDYLPD